MLREGNAIGVIALTRIEVRPFTDKQIELVTTFADQAAIAIENVRLFESVEHRTRELAKSLEDLQHCPGSSGANSETCLARVNSLPASPTRSKIRSISSTISRRFLTELIDELQETLRGVQARRQICAEITELTDTLQGNLEQDRAARQTCRFDRQEHAAAFARGLW